MDATQIPASRQPVVEQVNGRSAFTRSWYLFFQQVLTAIAPSGIAPTPITVGVSPFSYTAQNSGNLLITGGTVSLIEYGRGGIFTNTGITSGIVPLSSGDVARVTYSVLPTMTFLVH